MIESVQELTGDIATNQTLTGELDYRVTGGNVDDVKVNGTSVVENKVANVIVPTKASELENDAGYIEEIKTINNNSMLGTGNIDIPSIYFTKRTAIMGDTTNFDVTDLSEYNQMCLTANKFLPFIVNLNATTIDYIFYPFITAYNGKLRYNAFGFDGQGRFYKLYTSSIANPVVGALTQADLKLYMIESDVLITGNRFIQYTPRFDYDPATKKYVDDQVGNINTILATLTTPGGN